MKKVLIACALAFGISATTKAQCPINDILTTRDIQNVANMIEANTDCIKQALVQNPEYQSFKSYVDFLYNNSRTWIYHTNPQKEKLFTDFYQKWGKDYPSLAAAVPESEDFKKDIAAMIATDPAFFKQNKVTAIPQQYKQWLYVQDLNKKYGEHKVLSLAVAAGKIANLGMPAYSYAGNW